MLVLGFELGDGCSEVSGEGVQFGRGGGGLFRPHRVLPTLQRPESSLKPPDQKQTAAAE